MQKNSKFCKKNSSQCMSKTLHKVMMTIFVLWAKQWTPILKGTNFFSITQSPLSYDLGTHCCHCNQCWLASQWTFKPNPPKKSNISTLAQKCCRKWQIYPFVCMKNIIIILLHCCTTRCCQFIVITLSALIAIIWRQLQMPLWWPPTKPHASFLPSTSSTN